MRLHLLLFRALLWLYPGRFRRAYGADMTLLFAERLEQQIGLVRRAGFWQRTATNIAATAAAERWAALRRWQATPHNDSTEEGALMFGLLQDARYALRLLRRQPSFSAFVVLTLAIGIGANSAVFSVVNGVVLTPLPFAESERLIAIWGRFDPESGFDFPQFVLSNPEYVDYRNHSKAVGEMAAYGVRAATVGAAGGDPERVPAANVSSSFFPLLRVQPALGRAFTEPEDTPAGARVVVLVTRVLAVALWRGRINPRPGHRLERRSDRGRRRHATRVRLSPRRHEALVADTDRSSKPGQ